MHRNELLGDVEPQASAPDRHSVRRVHPMESGEELRHLLGGDAEPFVAHRNHGLAIPLTNGDADCAPGRHVLHGVGEKIIQNLGQPFPIGGHRQVWLLNVQNKAMPGALGREQSNDLLYGILDWRRHDVEVDRSPFDAGHVQQVVQDLGQTLRLLIDRSRPETAFLA